MFEQIDAGGDRNFSYLIADEKSRLGAVVDPGYDTSKLEARVRALGLRVAYVLNTHTHHDHVAGNKVFHNGETKLAACRGARVNPDIALDHGSVLEVGQHRIEVLVTPGHYLDSICLLVGLPGQQHRETVPQPLPGDPQARGRRQGLSRA
jgi:hydroxyacylglutathione hydrolase